jgi:hypothetical protein
MTSMKRVAVVIGLVLVAALPVPAQNLVTNGSFDTDTSGWTVSAPSGLLFVWTDLDALGTPTSGSGLATTTVTGQAVAISQCVPAGIVAGTSYDFAAVVRVSSWGVHGTSDVALNWFGGAACTGAATGGTSYSTNSLDTWVQLGQDDVTAPAGTASAEVVLRLTKDASGSTFQTYIDDVALVSRTPVATSQELFLPAAAAKHGVAPTYWSTDGWFANLTSANVTLSGAFLRPGADNSAAVASPAPLVTIPAGGFVAVDDLVTQLGGHEETGGVYLIASAPGGATEPLVVGTSYTFTPNETGAGYYGQGIPAVPAGMSHAVVVAGVFQDATHRTNVGALNTGSGTLSLAVSVYDANGGQVGSATWTLLPYAQTQVSLATLGVSSLSGGMVRFERTSTSGAFRAYASTVDQHTGDAVYNAAQ